MGMVVKSLNGAIVDRRVTGALALVIFALAEFGAGLYVANSLLFVLGLLLVGVLLAVALRCPPLWIFMLWLVLGFPFRFWGGISFAHGLPNLTLDRGLLGACGAALLAQALMRRQTLSPLSLADACVILYVGFSFVSLVLQADDLRQEGLNFVIRDFIPAVAYFLARNLFRDEGAVRRLVWILRWPALIVAVWALVEQVLGFELLTGDPLSTTGISSDFIRSSSGLGHPSATGTALAMLLPFVLHVYAYEERRFMKVLTLAQVALMAIAVYFTYIRAAWVAFALVILFMAAVHPRLRRLCGAIVVAAVLAVIVLWPQISTSSVYVNRITDPRDIADRLGIAEIQWSIFVSSPVIGDGGNTSAAVAATGLGSHNTYLNMLADAGLLSFIPYLIPLVMTLVQSLILLPRLPSDAFLGRGLVVVLWCAISSFVINGMSVDLRFYSILIGTYWVALALLMWIAKTSHVAIQSRTIVKMPAQPFSKRMVWPQND